MFVWIGKRLWQFLLVVCFCIDAWADIQTSTTHIIGGYSHAISMDLPVTYNARVKKWIHYFQTKGRTWFKRRLEKSHRYLPTFQAVLKAKAMPEDLSYIALIESGFSATATSSAKAVGYWQFIKTTANQYGLQTNWWLDERRDYYKSTQAATDYLAHLYKLFGSWYLAAAAYNMGETRLRHFIRKHNSKNFWLISGDKSFPSETRDYVPKMLAAIFIAKAPKLYGFKNIKPMPPYRYDYLQAPGGTDLTHLAYKLKLQKAHLKSLNPELLYALVPKSVNSHPIRVPKGHLARAKSLMRVE